MITVHLNSVGIARFTGPAAEWEAAMWVRDNKAAREAHDEDMDTDTPRAGEILTLLSKAGQESTREISLALGMTRPTTSRHLNTMAKRGHVAMVSENWKTGKIWEITVAGKGALKWKSI